MRQAAHAIRSSSAMLGAITLSARCGDLEQSVRSGTVVDTVASAAAIEGLYRAVVLALEAYVGSLASGAVIGQPPVGGPA
jgi:HPt (histidine-containing phosphotransfer) domain-containing protein